MSGEQNPTGGTRWRSDALAEAVARLESEMDAAWAAFLAELGTAAGTPDETALAWIVVADPAAYAWRVVDAALDRLSCDDCGSALGKGPGCDRCAYYDRLRYAAVELDRVGVPRGNEHAIRVSCAVARNRDRYSPRARAGYELLLPDLLAGALPTTPQAQAAKALINKLTPAECDAVTSLAEIERLASGRA